MTSLLQADAALAHAVSRLAGWPPLDTAFGVVTMLGLYGFVWLLVGGIQAWRRGGAFAEGFVRLAWSVALATLVVDGAFKPLVARPRPEVTGLTRTTVAAFVTSRTSGYSFPSGHAAQAAAGAYALALMWPRRRLLIYAFGVLIAISRVYLGVHYPLDIIGGLMVGWAAARLATAGTPCYILGSASAASREPR